MKKRIYYYPIPKSLDLVAKLNDNVFNFKKYPGVYDKADILQYTKHKPALIQSLSKMTASILKERRIAKCKEDEVGDEYAVVQKHLRIFLDDIIMIASAIVCGESGLYQASSSSSTEQPQRSLKVEREWRYRINVISSKAPLLLLTEQNMAGTSDFSIVHHRFPMALCLFEAKKTQLDLSDVSKPGVKKAIVQGGYQMLGDIQRLEHLVGKVECYSSMLTNGLVWLHLRMSQSNSGNVWMHSYPISVVKKNKKTKNTCDINIDDRL